LSVEVEFPTYLTRSTSGRITRRANGIGVSLARPGHVFAFSAFSAFLAKERRINPPPRKTLGTLNLHRRIGRPTIVFLTILGRRTRAVHIRRRRAPRAANGIRIPSTRKSHHLPRGARATFRTGEVPIDEISVFAFSTLADDFTCVVRRWETVVSLAIERGQAV